LTLSILIRAAWYPPFLALPLYFLAVMDAGMSAAGPHASLGEAIVLAVGPLISLASVAALRKHKFTAWKHALLAIPLLLSFC
jgi:hypothetical protein